jgi:hypothetical protein
VMLRWRATSRPLSISTALIATSGFFMPTRTGFSASARCAPHPLAGPP